MPVIPRSGHPVTIHDVFTKRGDPTCWVTLSCGHWVQYMSRLHPTRGSTFTCPECALHAAVPLHVSQLAVAVHLWQVASARFRALDVDTTPQQQWSDAADAVERAAREVRGFDLTPFGLESVN